MIDNIIDWCVQVLIIILLLHKAHLGVRLKREGYTVIAADWKKQEYFEEVE